jgi:LmbE family N-acetylglucosaminyl deacetylase
MTLDTSPPSEGAPLVISAHAGDFVWRTGGAIAPAAERGQRAKVLCLSFGERGESARARRDGLRFEAMECLAAQQHMRDYYTDLAKRRGVQRKRNAGPNLGLSHATMGEAYVRLHPQTTGVPA